MHTLTRRQEDRHLRHQDRHKNICTYKHVYTHTLTCTEKETPQDIKTTRLTSRFQSQEARRASRALQCWTKRATCASSCAGSIICVTKIASACRCMAHRHVTKRSARAGGKLSLFALPPVGKIKTERRRTAERAQKRRSDRESTHERTSAREHRRDTSITSAPRPFEAISRFRMCGRDGSPGKYTIPLIDIRATTRAYMRPHTHMDAKATPKDRSNKSKKQHHLTFSSHSHKHGHRHMRQHETRKKERTSFKKKATTCPGIGPVSGAA